MEGPVTPVISPLAESQVVQSFQPTVIGPQGGVAPSRQPQGYVTQRSSSPRQGPGLPNNTVPQKVLPQQGLLFPQVVPPQRNTQGGGETPQIVPPQRNIVQQVAEMPQVLSPQIVENPLRAALSDRTGGALLLDAVTADCGHTFGGASLQRVLSTGACTACRIPIDPGRLIPNLAVRAAAAAFQAEESLIPLKRGREGECGRVSMPFVREPEQKAFVFPYKLHDRVRVKGNKRTPPHFVGKAAVIVHEGLNGWYTVRLTESGEETRLQYRSLEVISDDDVSKLESGAKCEAGAKNEVGTKSELGAKFEVGGKRHDRKGDSECGMKLEAGERGCQAPIAGIARIGQVGSSSERSAERSAERNGVLGEKQLEGKNGKVFGVGEKTEGFVGAQLNGEVFDSGGTLGGLGANKLDARNIRMEGPGENAESLEEQLEARNIEAGDSGMKFGGISGEAQSENQCQAQRRTGPNAGVNGRSLGETAGKSVGNLERGEKRTRLEGAPLETQAGLRNPGLAADRMVTLTTAGTCPREIRVVEAESNVIQDDLGGLTQVSVGGSPTQQIENETLSQTQPVVPLTVQVTMDVPRIRGGAPVPRDSPSSLQGVSFSNGFDPPGARSPVGKRVQTTRRQGIDRGLLARISADVSDDEKSAGPSSGAGDGENNFEERWDVTNAGGGEEMANEERGFGGGGEKLDTKTAPQRTLSVPERDRCVKSNGRGWRCKLRKASGYQYCQHHQRNWDGHEKQWKKAFPSAEGSPASQGGKTKASVGGGGRKPKEGAKRPRKKAKSSAPKPKKAGKVPGAQKADPDELRENGLVVHKQAKSIVIHRLDRAPNDGKESLIGHLYKRKRKPTVPFEPDGDSDYVTHEVDARNRPALHDSESHFLSQKRIEKAQKYKTLVANKEFIEDDRGNLKVLDVAGCSEPTGEQLLTQVERVCPELAHELDSLSSVDITAAVAAVAATGREEAEVLLGRLLMRHSSKELALVQEVIDQEKRIVQAKLEDLNKRDEARAQWKKRPFLGFDDGGGPKKKRSVNLAKVGRVPRLFSSLFPSEFGDLEEIGKDALGVDDLLTESGVRDGVNELEPGVRYAAMSEPETKPLWSEMPGGAFGKIGLNAGLGEVKDTVNEGLAEVGGVSGPDGVDKQAVSGSDEQGSGLTDEGATREMGDGEIGFEHTVSETRAITQGLPVEEHLAGERKEPPNAPLRYTTLPIGQRASITFRTAGMKRNGSGDLTARVEQLGSESIYGSVKALPSPRFAAGQRKSREQLLGQHRQGADGFGLEMDMLGELEAFAPMQTTQGEETDDSTST